ncbi:DNRLRE domain-containing protein [Streptosporangium roseum]|uniref:DNRLRE domain-containing protein n=1 Tax=Streptosporangium roseum TaxID=2001 RepID=UPI003327F829
MDKVLEAAKAKATKSGKRVEIPERNTETSTLYANPDGKTLRMELHTQPIRVKNADGKGFTPIDTTLVEEAGAIKPKAAKGSLVLSAGRDKSLLKSQAADATAKISTPSVLPEPRLKGNTATYPGAYGKGRDLVVTADPTGFRQQITIAERPTGPVSFRVPVDLPEGLSFKKNTAGRPTIVGKDGKTLTDVRPTLIQDAKAADPDAPLDAGKVGKAAVTIDDDVKTLVFTPDAAFLADPATTYPVTMTAAASDWYEGHTGQWQLGGMDTWINDVDYQDSWDTFTQDQIVVGKSYASSIAKRWRGYLQFPDIPAEFAGSKVENADLHLWNYQSNDCGISVGSGITARQITSDWDETTLHWNSQPSVTSVGADTEYGAYSTDCSGSMNYAWDLTYSLNGIVQAWVDGVTNYGIQLTAGNESELRNWRRYRSEDAGGCTTSPLEACKGQLHPPILTVDVEPPPPPVVDGFTFMSPDPITSLPTFEEARARSIYEPAGDENTSITNEFGAQIGGQRDGEPAEVGMDDLDMPPEGSEGSDGEENTDEDTRAPQLISVEPANGATDVPLDTALKMSFSEPVETSVILKNGAGSEIAGAVSYDETGSVVTFTPAQELKPGTTYTAEIPDAMDPFENQMDSYTWSFTTVRHAAGNWSLDEGEGETAADSSGNDHDAALTPTASWIAGKNGNAISNQPSQAQVAAAHEAAQQGKAVEVADETTATSVTYAQPDGKTFKTEITAGPVRARQGGGWVPIDTTLAEQGGKLRPKALAEGAAVEISAGGTDPFVKMAADGRSYALRWPTPLPKPTVKGSVATYIDAAGTGADLVVTALPTGFRHEVVLRQRPAKPLQLRIGVDDEGLTLTEGKGGRLLLKGKDKKLVASAARPAMSDGGGKGRLASAKRGKAGTDVVTKDGRTELVIKPDQAFLADTGTTYPVRVAAAVTLPLGADVEVTTYDTVELPAFPDNQYLTAGTMTGGFKSRTHLRFDTTSLQGSTVTAATLSMNTIDAHTCGPALTNGIQVARLTGAWDPDNLYWANKPAHTTEDASTNFKGVNQDCEPWPDSMDWNVTGIAQDWAAGAANHGLVLKSPGETNINNYRTFTASEDTDFNIPPKLTVATSGPASAPTATDLAITPAQASGGTTTVTSLTPQLTATVTDTASGGLTGQFEVEHDPAATGQGTGQIWTGTSQAVTSGAQATVSVPAGKLTDGWKIRWRARAANATASTTSAWSAWQTATIDVPNPTAGAFQVTPSQVVNGVTTATNLTPTLHTTVTDPATQPLRADFELEHDPAAPGQGTGQIWAGSVDSVASGTQASATVPDGKLTDGWKVRWRVRAVNTATTVGSPWSDWQSLTVDVPDPVSEPAVGALQVTPSEQVDGTTVTRTRTPTLLAQVNDPAGRPLRAEAEIEHDPAATGQGTGQIWTGSADNVPTGTQASIAVPADTLTDGWKVRWRARAVSATAASAWSDWQSFTISLPKPTATGLTVTPSKVVDGVTVTTTLTPTLQAALTHPAGQALRAEAEIEHDPAAPAGQGTGQIWTGAVDGVASGTQASIAVPADTLTDGWKVRWRLRAVAGDTSSAWSDWQQVTVDVTQPGEEPLAQTSGPVIRTDQSFTAAAWLRWSDKDGDYTVLEQKGTHQAPFRLGNTPDRGLVFTLTSADTADATTAGVSSGVEPPVGNWFHLAGVYDATAETASLYLNGTLVESAPVSFPAWHADTAMTLGSRVKGDLDEVQIYQQSLDATQIQALLASPEPILAAKPLNSAQPPAQPMAAVGGGFDYKHVSLEDCYDTQRAPRFTDAYSRMQERPHSVCWTTWIGHGGWEEVDENGVKKRKNRTAWWVRVFPGPLRIPAAVLDKVTDDDVFTFRATWVAHTYIGNPKGDAIYKGGSSVSGMRPQHIKFFVKLSDFGIWNRGVRRTELDDDLNNVQVEFELKSEGCQIPTSGNPSSTQLRTIQSWRGTPYLEYRIETPKPSTKLDRTVCSIMPALTQYKENKGWLPLWDQEVLSTVGKRVGVVRWGQGTPTNTLWSPSFRCDWRKLGEYGEDKGNNGGCIYIRADRVFTMSKSRDDEYLDVIRHIERALNPATNPSTYPPLRPGDTTDNRVKARPPIRWLLGNELPKAIPGNYAAPPNTIQGSALWRGPKGSDRKNRAVFSGFPFTVQADNNYSLQTRANYCKYYTQGVYEQYGWAWNETQCDEYPFASTQEGAAKDKLNYSVQAVRYSHNRLHGTALQMFYGYYRLLNYDPVKTLTKTSDSPFWVKIVD